MTELYACATHTLKSLNQDFCCVIENVPLGFKGIIVADGIGSHSKSELSSKFCAESLKKILEGIDDLNQIDFVRHFCQVKEDLINYSKTILSETEIEESKLGTTLLCAISLKEKYVFAYVGNGSLWIINGNYNHFDENRYLPWNVANILVPHTIEEEGRSALYKFISIDDKVSAIPTVISFSKNEDSAGDIILISSDGVYTNDEVKVGKDDNNVIWIMGEESMSLLYQRLNKFFDKNVNDSSNEDLGNALNMYLTELSDKNLMHDDTTLGILISPKALLHQQRRWEKNCKVNEANSGT